MSRTVLLLALVATLCGAPFAQTTEPDRRPITLIVPYPAGGPSDTGARRIAPELERELGQPVVVQNIAGATGAVATQKVASATPDGLTLMYGSPNELILAPATNPAVRYQSGDLVNVGLVGITPLALVTHGQTPYKTADALVGFLRADTRRSASYASVGVGSMQHLAAANLALDANLRLLHVPYKGAAPALVDLLGQQVDVSVMTLTGGTLDHIRAGKLICLGILSRQRTALADDLPTINEGSSFKDVEYTLWGGIFVTARAPLPVLQRLNDAMNRVLVLSSVRAKTQANGAQPGEPMTLAELDARYSRETARYQRIVKTLNVRLE